MKALMDIKVQTDTNTIIVSAFNNPLLPTGDSDQKKKKKTNQASELNINTIIDQMDLTNIYIIIPSKSCRIHILFSSP
jgi:hypothetical protein